MVPYLNSQGPEMHKKFLNFQKTLIACDLRDHELGVCAGYKAKLFFAKLF